MQARGLDQRKSGNFVLKSHLLPANVDTSPRLSFPEHAPEDRVDVFEVIAEVELLFDLGIAQILFHVRIFLEQRM